VGYEVYLHRFDPDPGLLSLRGARKDWRWGKLIHRPSEIEGLAYELNPEFDGGYKGVRIRVNSDGLRDDEVRPTKGPDLVRIGVLGDSTTFGFGVSGRNIFTRGLEDRLKEAGTGWEYEVLNFGVSGYSTADEALVLREKALDFDLDLVIVAYNLNDPDTERRQPLHRFFGETHWWQNTHTWRKYDDRRFQRAVQTVGGGDPFRYAHAPGGRNWQSVVDGFASMAETARAADLPVLLVLFPVGLTPPDPADYPYIEIHRQVGGEGKRNGFAVLDLTRKFGQLDELGFEYLLPDMHPNERGHAAAAQAISVRILSQHEELLGVPVPTGDE